MEFEVNEEGLKLFNNNPKKYIEEVKRYCNEHNIPVYFEDDGECMLLSLLDDDYFQGCMIEYRKDVELPFILDYDNPFDVSYDCPSIEEAFIRFWNMNEILKNKEVFSREKILSGDNFSKYLKIYEFEKSVRISNNYEEVDRAILYEEEVKAKAKKCIVQTINQILELSSREQREVTSLIPLYLKANWKRGVMNSLENIKTLKKCLNELLNILHLS